MPVLAVSDWLLAGRGQGRVRWWHPLLWLVYPAAYAMLALVVLNRVGRRAPYYFLDPDGVGPAVVIANVGVLGAVVLALGYTLLPSAGWLHRRELTPHETF